MALRTLLQGVALVALFVIPSHEIGAQALTPPAAVPLDAKTAILDAFRLHRVVGLGDAHGNQQGEAFQLDLISDSRLPVVVNDILVESGNSRYQDLVDRFVSGEEVPAERLQRIWLDTTQQQVASLEPSKVVMLVRRITTCESGKPGRWPTAIGSPST